MSDDMGIKYYRNYELNDHIFTPGIRVKYKTDNVTGYNRDFAFRGWGTPSVPYIKSGFIRNIIRNSDNNIYADVMPNPTALNRAIRVRLDLLEPMDENLPPVGGGINLKRKKYKKYKKSKKSSKKKSKKKSKNKKKSKRKKNK